MIALRDVEIGKGTSTGRILPLFGTFDPLRRGKTKRRRRRGEAGGPFNQPRTPPSPSLLYYHLLLSLWEFEPLFYAHFSFFLSVNHRGLSVRSSFPSRGARVCPPSPLIFGGWLGWLDPLWFSFHSHSSLVARVENGPGLGQPLSCHEGTDSSDCGGSAGPNPCAPIVAVVDLIEDCRSFGCCVVVDRTDLSHFIVFH